MTNYSQSYSHIQLKRGTTANWAYRNPILLPGEAGLEIIDNGSLPDTYKIKIGDGVNTWTQLPYYGDTQDVTSLVADSVTSTVVSSSTTTVSTSLKATSTALSSLSEANPPLMVGGLSSLNLAFDGNEIQARNNGLASSLFLQPSGGTTHLGSNLVIDNGSVTVSGGGSVSATINSSGYVTFPRQPAYYGGINAVTSSASNYYPSLTNVFNVGFSRSGNNRLTAQVAGKYYVAAQQLVNTPAASAYFHIYKNGSTVAYAYSASDDTYDLSVSALVDLQVNDYIELYYSGTTSYTWSNPHSSYSVFKVS